jgi:DNA-binding NarL/FixJ family response regulator
MGVLRILLADDHDVVRRQLRNLLEEQPGWQVLAEANNGTEAVNRERETKPDVTLLDIIMPSLDGLGAARQIVQSGSQTKILILCMHESEVLIHEALEAGAWGCVLKADGARGLIPAVERLQHNKILQKSKTDQGLLDSYLRKGKPLDEKKSRLTSRQREIVQLLIEGMTSRQIAVTLGMSQKTAETYRAAILQRLNCHSTKELVRYALGNEIVRQ